MKNNSLPSALAAITLALPLAFSVSAAHAQKPDLTAVDKHIALATAAAKTDLLGPLGLCKTASPADGPDFMEMYNSQVKKPPLQPMRRIYPWKVLTV